VLANERDGFVEADHSRVIAAVARVGHVGQGTVAAPPLFGVSS
jgi:hypothetical protein